MCIIVDTNTLSLVFDESKRTDDFLPVFDWVVNGKGKVVYGGTKYITEIGKYLNLFVELQKVNKAVNVDASKVDAATKKASDMIQHKDFDDQHIVGLLIVSGCKVICSHDKRAYPYFRHKDFFMPASKKPKIYSGKRNKDLLADRNIADVCKPCSVATNQQRQILSKI